MGLSSCFILLGWHGDSGLRQLISLKLSNSGETLKLTVPTVQINSVRGWVNSSCKVTSCKIRETEIGNRGSKLVRNLTIKEQRVNGSWCFVLKHLRNTLISFERNYQVRNPSNQINRQIRFYATKLVQNCVNSTIQPVNPWFITGFIEGKASFNVNVTRSQKMKSGWRVQIEFKIGLHKKDKNLLERINTYFGVGKIYKQEPDAVQYIVQTAKELVVILNHLEKYPPITAKKCNDLVLFKQVVHLVYNKEHLTFEGLRKFISLKASINKGLSSELKIAFPGIISLSSFLEKKTNYSIPNPFWLAGFTSAEGCFFINIVNSPSHKLKKRVILIFLLTQHIREKQLMESFKDYFSCGNFYKNKEVFLYRIESHSDIINKIVPFFKKHPILGEKSSDFEDWCKVVELIQNKVHLTQEGLDQIIKIKAGMNKGRPPKEFESKV